ncbi:MAG TPA: pyridoxamine 5'-phosphate oxidase family protein [Candidatus Aquilonibacter sp.]|nr:pyridoxamine 5'-phosphate oxidase family protein [Candidatus Aquilonibacter sp.]
MIINAMSETECRALLSRASMGRLGCSLNDQPYVLPIHVACESDYIYVLSTFGQKIQWMRANPKVCVEIDETGANSEWASVVVSGQYEELKEPQYSEERSHARKLLEKRTQWWQTAFAERQLKAGDSLISPVFFRIHIDSVTGLRATANGKNQS